MDPQQRYCVNCAARRGNGANPASRYFAAMSKRSRRPLIGPPAKQSPTSRAAAVAFFALLPLAVGLGVVVGRSDSAGNDNRTPCCRPCGNGRPPPPAPCRSRRHAECQKAKKAAKGSSGAKKGEGKVVAHTDNGDVHEVASFKRLQAEGRRRHPNRRRKPRTDRRKLHQGPAEPARRDRRRRRRRRQRPGAFGSGTVKRPQLPKRLRQRPRRDAPSPKAGRSSHRRLPSRRPRTKSSSPSATGCWRSSR